MATKLHIEAAKDFLLHFKNVELSLVSEETWQKEVEDLKKNKELREIFENEKANAKFTYKDKHIFINDYSKFLYYWVGKYKAAKFKEEVSLNLKRLYEKYKLLNYIKILQYKIKNILRNFYYQEAVWTDLDLPAVLFYPTIAPEELHWEGYSHIFKGTVMMQLSDVFSESKAILKDVYRNLKLRYKLIENVPKEKFESPKVTTLAYYYYYMISAKAVSDFDKEATKNNIPIKRAMRRQIIKDGFEYPENFYKEYRNVEKKAKEGNLNRRSIKKALLLLNNQEAEKRAIADLYYIDEKDNKRKIK